MPAAILFRGHAIRKPGELRPWGVDYRKCIDSHRRHLIEPLASRYGSVDVFLSAHHMTPPDRAVKAAEATLCVDYGSTGDVFSSGQSQREVFVDGLDLILKDFRRVGYGDPPPYDLVATCRFDLELKCCPLDFGTFKPDAVNFLWREWNAANWEDHNRVPDAIHLIAGLHLESFRNGVVSTPSETCMHLVYRPVVRRCGENNVNVQSESYFDSNSDVQENPVYKMVRLL